MQRLLFVARLLKLLSSHCGLNHNFLIFHFLRDVQYSGHVYVITNVCFIVRTTNCHLSALNFYLQIEIFQNMKFYSQNSSFVPPYAAKAPVNMSIKKRNQGTRLPSYGIDIWAEKARKSRGKSQCKSLCSCGECLLLLCDVVNFTWCFPFTWYTFGRLIWLIKISLHLSRTAPFAQ